MAAKVTNNAYGTLSAGITDTATTLTLNSGEGARFPALGVGDYFYATLVDTSNNLEIIKVTARSVDSMTIVRGQDGTTARAYGLNDRLELRPTAALFNEKADTSYVDTGLAGKLDYVAPGPSGNVLTSNGSEWVSGASASGYGLKVYTSPGTWAKPATLKGIKVTTIGGGGGGGGARGTTYTGIPAPTPLSRSSGGGGGGGYAVAYIPAASIPGPQSVTIGTGGSGGPAPGTNNSSTTGSSGNTTSFGSLISSTGGSGGGNSGGSGGSGVAPTGLTIPGSTGTITAGGSTQLSLNSIDSSNGATGRTGDIYGGGGGGASTSNGTPYAGGVGANGIILVEEFY